MNKTHIRKMLSYSRKNEIQLSLERMNDQIEASCLGLNIDHLIQYVDVEKGTPLYQVRETHPTYLMLSGLYFMPLHENSLPTVNKVILDFYKSHFDKFELSMIEIRAILRRLKRRHDYDHIKVYGLERLYANDFHSELYRQAFLIDQMKKIASEINAVIFISWNEFSSEI